MTDETPQKTGSDAEAAESSAGPKPPAGGPPAKRERPKRGDRTTPVVRIVVIAGTLALAGYIIYDYATSPVPVSVRPAPAPLVIPNRAVSPGGWLYGLTRVEVTDEKPWVKVGMEVARRKLSPPASGKGTSLKEAYLYVALFTDGSYVQLRQLEGTEVRAIVCASAGDNYGLVRSLFERCSKGGSPVTLVLVRVGDDYLLLATLEGKQLMTQGMYEEMRYFCQCALAGTPAEHGHLEFALDVMQTYEAALLSGGERVAVA